MKRNLKNLCVNMNELKSQLQELKQSGIQDFLVIKKAAAENDTLAVIILDQVVNFAKKKPSWKEATIRQCIVARNMSPGTYEYLRSSRTLKLPCRKTLEKYVGPCGGQVGFSDLVEKGLEIEKRNLPSPQSRMCSLVID
ncbi:unnamed protein product, partial [Ixodes pacificus]